ncbi:MAG: DsrE family protein [Alphaproteobacteria bacterium]|uniref:DsrE family protein n=1 Tax=Candidatus Nitrobium versatile TaxID=2884831 RepID=A0A953JFI9_9BACT|nr:DsrE family protein [Candidatus Nitrobium versatile]
MATRKLGFVIRTLPYKIEGSRLGMTHAISSQTVEIYLEDGDLVEPTVCFIGDGVLNCLKGQQAMKHYGITSLEQHAKNSLLLDLNVMICKEDLDKLGIPEDALVLDAEDIGGETAAKIVPYSEIQKVMESVDHLLFC